MRKLLPLFFLLVSCANVTQELNPDKFYKRDMDIKVNGYQGEGVLVVPRASSYSFDINAAGKLDLFTFTTCHREQTKEKAGERGWFRDKSRRRFVYKPAPLEAEGYACPVDLGGYEQKRGRHSWGFVDFEHPDFDLPAKVSCNGFYYNSRGVTACQAKVGLMQEIKFPEPVLAPLENVCIVLEAKDDMTFRYKMPKGRCTFRFLTKSGKKRWHRMTTVGYESILIRE